MKIESYSFGRIVIDGKEYGSDLIIFSDHVSPGWWRRHGHVLSPEDLEEVFNWKPDLLIVGQGYSGMMKPDEECLKLASKSGIQIRAMGTKEACGELNRALEKGIRAAGAFHLTC